MQRREWRVVGGQLLGPLRHLLVVVQVVSHELEERLLLRVELDLALQIVTVLLELLAPIFVDLNLILQRWHDQLSVFLKIFQLLQDVRTALLCKCPEIVIDAHIFKAGEELAQLLLSWALEKHPIDKRKYLHSEL